MKDSQIALIDQIRLQLHQVVTRIERVRYVVGSQVVANEGDVILWFGDRMLHLDVENDGERLRLTCEPWIDPFGEPLSKENNEYIATHGKWTLFDVSREAPYSTIVGISLDAVLPISNEFNKLTGVSLVLDGTVLNVFVDCDELLVTWGASNVPHWGTLR